MDYDDYGRALDERYVRMTTLPVVLPVLISQVECGEGFDLYQRLIIGGTLRFKPTIIDDDYGGRPRVPQAPVQGPHDHIDDFALSGAPAIGCCKYR
jgi:hypothetical protein